MASARARDGRPAEEADDRRPDVACGDTITRDTELRHDIGPCPGDGLVIGTDHVELDCNGHRILGTGGGRGVYAEGVEDAEIEDCVIEDFEYGVRFLGVEGGEIERNEISTDWEAPAIAPDCVLLQEVEGVHVKENAFRQCRGMEVSQGEDLRIAHNEVEDCEIGFLVSAADSRVDHNEVQDCTGDAFDFEGTSRSRVAYNRVERVFEGFLISGSHENEIEHNRVEQAQGPGFFVLFSQRNEIEDNQADENQTGFVLQGPGDNEFEENEANDNEEFGFFLGFDADGNEFEENEACGNGDADLFISATADGNEFDDNEFCVVAVE